MLRHYFASTLRHYAKHRITTLINLACLTLGLFCFVTAYALVSFYRHSDRHLTGERSVYTIAQRIFVGPNGNATATIASTSWRVADLLKADFPELTVARASIGAETSIVAGDAKERVMISYADDKFLKVLDLPFVAGNSRTALDEPHSAVVSDRLAARLFGSTTNVVGKTLVIGNSERVVIRGVMTEPRQPSHISVGDSLANLQFEALVSADVQQALVRAQNPTFAENLFGRINGGFFYFTYVAMPHGFTSEEFNRQLQGFSDRHTPNRQRLRFQFSARPLPELSVTTLNVFAKTDQTGVSSTTLLLALGVTVLLVACLNYVNLATAQAFTRVKEVALQRVVGATRSQVLAQHCCDALLLTLCAAALAVTGCVVFSSFAGTQLQTAFGLISGGDGALEFWSLLALLVVGIGFGSGALPALALARIRPALAFRSKSFKPGSRSMAGWFVGFQFATASALLIAVLVMNAQNNYVRHIAAEMSPDPVIVLANGLREANVSMDTLRGELLGKPGIKIVSGTPFVPWSMTGASYAMILKSPDAAGTPISSSEQGVDHGFFQTLGVPLLAGRVFEERDARRDAQTEISEVVVDRSLAVQLGWSSPQDAIGKLLYSPTLADTKAPARPSRIIGVVEDRSLTILNGAGRATLYRLTPQLAAIPLIRVSRAELPAAVAAIDAAWNKLAPNVPMKRRFMDEEFERNYARFELITGIFSTLALFAFAIGGMGLVGMAMLVTARRTQEIGIRKTLGAGASQIVALLLREFCKPVIAANLLVWPLVYFAAQSYLTLFMQRVSLTPVPFAASLLIVLLIACAAVASPAIRAARLNPANVLRHE